MGFVISFKKFSQRTEKKELNFIVALLDYLHVVRFKFDLEGGKVDHLSLGGVVALIKLSQMMQLS